MDEGRLTESDPLAHLLAEIDQEWDGAHPKDGYYSEAGDCFVCFKEDTPYFAERVDGLLTVYRALPAGRIIGLQVKAVGARRIQSVNARVETADGPDAAHLVDLLLKSFALAIEDVGSDASTDRVAAYRDAIRAILSRAA